MHIFIMIILGLIGSVLFISVITALLKLVIMLLVPASIIFIAYVIWKQA
jgi:hypothetical protein